MKIEKLITNMRLFNIYYHDICGNTDLVATTNDVDKWLKDNNKNRKNDGLDTEELDDFEIIEADAYIYL